MTQLQLLVTILIILLLIKTVADFKKNKITLSAFLSWLILWLVILAVAVMPKVTNFLEKRLVGAGRGIDALIYLSILFIFFILFKIIVRLERMKQEITEIVCHLALKNPKKK